MSCGFYTENDMVKCAALDLRGVIHAFSTRRGGVSKLEHTKSLNLAFGRGDDAETVIENRRIFAEKAGFDPSRLVLGAQTHSTNVVFADGSVGEYGNTDGFVTCKPGVFLGVKTADCQPVLFYDPIARVAGACHAGWRGTAGGIAAKTVSEMEKLGAKKEDIIAALGPCIGACCFEVKEDFVENISKTAPSLLKFVYGKDGKYRADIREMNRYILLGAGLKEENVHVSGECTCCSPEKFFSHRKSGGLRGTMISVIGMI